MKSKQLMKTILLLSILILNLNCTRDLSADRQYGVPAEKNDGLHVSALQESGFDASKVMKASQRIRDGKYGEVHSMLIYKDDKLVFEEYYEGHKYQWDAPNHYGEWVSWTGDMLHCIQSDTKSITSLCIGIAIDLGYIESVDQSIFDYLPEYQQFKTGGKESITIEHLLTMTSGLQWEEWKISLSSVENDQIGIWFHEGGPMDYVLQKPLVAEPGKRFNYSGGDIQILAEILKNATGMPLDAFSQKYLFEPMGITDFEWYLIFPTGEVQAAGGLKLTPRGMVKVGAMMLDKGIVNGNRIISEDWIDKCTVPFSGNTGIKVPGEDMGRVGYSYTWWTKQVSYQGQQINCCFALGWGGQKIIMLTDLDMVVVFTGANYTRGVHEYKILKKFILPAVI